ncbi:MAG: PD-(D/E)XK nuclease family protein [Rouxiella aceris]|uniref:PDDEXK-like family protein n=1 Tax=Rouxiella aceris TaxID=2703884 RepID=UPI002850C7AF|nr:PD-(D/E)XK nuclease family protein [Rouxiella aceris]MDR3431032.1 PD-(D/E)XK nuclease family protein [Rouxiella aceris]
MDLPALEELLTRLKSLPITEKGEANIFSLGARGHYENPVSDLLAFFIDPDAQHGLNTLVLEALLECLSAPVDASLLSPPAREVMTQEGTRIDLLLESEEWVMALENKIWHQQNNPFTDYSGYLEQKYPDKKSLLLVLSPEGQAPAGWTGISYSMFISVLSPKLGMACISSPLNKWQVLLREFMLHLRSLMSKNTIAAETETFVLENLLNIQEAVLLKNAVVKSLQEDGLRFLTEHFSDRGYEVATALNHWEGYPALRFWLSHWVSESYVVLFLDRTPGRQFEVRTYICNLTTPTLQHQARQMLIPALHDDCWKEKSDSVFTIVSRLSRKHEEKHLMFQRVAKALDQLNEFELHHER